MNRKRFEILVIEDNPADARLIGETLGQGESPVHLSVVGDGVAAMEFLRNQGPYSHAPLPDLILLDLNLPHKDGREVLAEIKSDKALRHIPVVVLTGSDDEADVHSSYDLSANCYVSKPMDVKQFSQVLKVTEDFWLEVAQLPRPNRED